MIDRIIRFIKKSHTVLIVILAAVIFFLGYNTYLVDYSLVNLKSTLVKVDSVGNLDDAKKLISLLDDSLLQEVVSRESEIEDLSYLELAKDILGDSQYMNQLEDVKYILREAIGEKEKERPAVVRFLDKIFAPAAKVQSRAKLESRVDDLKRRIATSRDKRILQDIYYELGGLYVRLGNLVGAREAYRTVAELIPGTQLADKSRFNLAWNEKFQGNLDEAIKQFEVLSQAPGQEGIVIYSKYQIAEIYKLKGDYEKANAIFKEIAQSSPGSKLGKLADFQVCYLYLHGIKDLEKAEEMFAKIKDLCEGSDLAVQIERTKIRNIAYRYNRKGFDLLRQGYDLSNPDKYREALVYFSKALEVLSGDGIACIGKALAYLWLEEPDKALEFAKKTKRLYQRYEFISVNLCYVYLQLGLVDEALAECKRFIAVNKSSFRVYYNLGFIYIIQNRIKESVGAFHKVTNIEPKFAPAFNNLGYCLWQLRKYSDAVKKFEEAINIEPKVLEAHFNLGLAYIEIGKYAEAEKKFIDALDINPRHFEAQVCLREVKRIIRERAVISDKNKSPQAE